MVDEYQLRKDIDKLKAEVDNIDLSKYSTSSEVNLKYTRLSNDLDTLDDDLGGLNDDLIEFSTTLINLRSNLIEFNEELIDFDENNTNLASDLSKLKDNLHLFTSATQKLTTDLSALDGKLDDFGDDVFGQNGLDSQLTALVNAVGDSNSGLVKSMKTLQDTVGDGNSGLVKQANDTTSSITQLNTDLSGLSTSLSTLTNTVGDNSKGLVKQLNDLDSSTGSFYNDVFGTGGLSSRLSATESSLTTTNSDLGKLVSSLNILSSYLTTFEGTLEEFEEQLDDDGIDISDLNANIVALFGAIGTVKSDVTSVEGDISQAQQDISDTTSSMDNVKIDLYGTKTVDGETVPKDPSDTASANSLKSNLTAVRNTVGDSNSGLVKQATDATNNISNVQTDLYGSNKDPAHVQEGSFAYNLNTLDGAINNTGGLIDQLVDVSDSIDDVNSEVFGTDQQGNPLTPSDTPTSTSLIGRTNAVRNDLYGNGTIGNPQTGSLKDLITTVDDDINNQTTGLKVVTQDVVGTIGEVGQAGTVLDDIDKSLTDIDNLQTTMYKGANGTGTINSPANGSLMSDVNTTTTQIGTAPSGSSSGSGILKDISDVQSDISNVQGDISDIQQDVGDVNVSADGNLQSQIAHIINNLLLGEGWICITVATIAERDALNGRLNPLCYVEATGKYYRYDDGLLLGGQ